MCLTEDYVSAGGSGRRAACRALPCISCALCALSAALQVLMADSALTLAAALLTAAAAAVMTLCLKGLRRFRISHPYQKPEEIRS